MTGLGDLKRHAWFWWSNREMGFLRWLTLASFRKWHPDWKMTLVRPQRLVESGTPNPWGEQQDYVWSPPKDWTDRVEELGVRILPASDIFPDATDHYLPNVMADWMKWRVLGNSSGVCSDMDILWVKSLDWESLRSVETGVFRYMRAAYPTGLLVGNNSPLFREFDEYVSSQNVRNVDGKTCNDYQWAGPTLIRNYMSGLTEEDRSEYTFLPTKMIYPFVVEKKNRVVEAMGWEKHLEQIFLPDSSSWILPDACCGIHWYGGCRAAAACSMSVSDLSDMPESILRREAEMILL